MKSLLFGFAIVTLCFSLSAQDAKPAAPTPPPGRPNPVERAPRPDRPRPQSGKIIGIDKSASTITVGPAEGSNVPTAITSNVVFTVSTNTVFLKAGKRVKLEDMTVGDPVRFAVRKTPEGKDTATFVVVGAPIQARPAPAPKAPAAPEKK